MLILKTVNDDHSYEHFVKEFEQYNRNISRYHTPSNCATKSCRKRQLCARCETILGNMNYSISTCFLCEDKFCSDCDSFCLLTTSSKLYVCGDNFDELHTKTIENNARLIQEQKSLHLAWTKCIGKWCGFCLDFAGLVIQYYTHLTGVSSPR